MADALLSKPLTTEQREIVEKNTKLIWFVVNDWRGEILERMVMFQEGSFGLMKAAVGYKPSMGEFSTYAVRAIRTAILRAEVNAGLIHIPQYLRQKENKDHPYQEFARRIRVFSIDASEKSDTFHPAVVDEYAEREYAEIRAAAVSKACAGLSRLERRAVDGSIVRGKSYKILAHEYKTSGARIRDARSRAEHKLRKKLSAYA